jgi:hypothetical protein
VMHAQIEVVVAMRDHQLRIDRSHRATCATLSGWTCLQCSFENDALQKQCMLCEQENVHSLSKGQSDCVDRTIFWSCTSCFWLNIIEPGSLKGTCSVCNHPRHQVVHDESDHSMPQSSPSLSFAYSSDFDTNGILYYLGCLCDPVNTTWQNPCILNLVSASASSLQSDSSPVSSVCGRETVRCVSQSSSGNTQWMAIKFESHRVRVSAYTIRHYISYSTGT